VVAAGAAVVIEQWERWHTVVLMTVATAPLGVLVAWWRGWHRGLAEVGMVVGTLPWTWMALTPLHRPARVSLVPFADLAAQVRAPQALAQILPNLVFLLPFGALAPLRWRWFTRWWRLFAVAAAYSATVELLQYALHIGRVASVDDVILNACGAVLGGLITLAWWPARERRSGAPAAPGDDPGPAVDGQRLPVG
jgi:hypothetical protein